MENQWPHGGNYYYSPMNWHPSAPPETPQQLEKRLLRKKSNLIGGVMLMLLAATQLTFSVITFILMLTGILDFKQLSQAFFGLSNTTYLLLYAVVYIIAMGLPVVMALLCGGYRERARKNATPVKPSDLFFGSLAGLAVCMLANIITSLLMSFLSEFGVEPPTMPQLLEATPISYLLNLLVIAVLPAVLEELVFRRFVLQFLRPYGDWFAVTVAAVLFGLIHGNILQIPFAFIVGLALGWLYVATNNLFVPIFVHFLNNALSVSLDYLSRFLPSGGEQPFMLSVIFTVGVLGAVSFLLLFLQHSILLRKSSTNTMLSSGERVAILGKAPLLVISVILFVLLTVVKTA